jgi:toxin ParE1/3/4
MALPRFTTDASRDLEEIVHYIGARNPGAATRLTDRLETECWRLAREPGIGQLRPDLAPGLRFCPVGNYLIFYRESAEGIQVIRVLHGARDYGAETFQ